MKTQLTLFVLLITISMGLGCEVCSEMELTSEGDFGLYFPRFLGTWLYSGEWDGNPFFTCDQTDCMGLRAFLLFLRDSDGSLSGEWAITDCHPEDVACGGGAHRILKSGTLSSDLVCPHQAPQDWRFCSGDLVTGGGCTQYTRDDSVNFACTVVDAAKGLANGNSENLILS